MTRTLYVRDSFFMRLVSVIVALSFTLSIAGSGFAAPVVAASDSEIIESAAATQAPSPEADAPHSSGNGSPSELDPSAQFQEGTAPDDGEEKGVGQTEESSEGQAEAGVAAEATAPARTAKSPAEPAAVAAALAYADFTDVDWEAYRISPPQQVGWAKANLGEYREGDWIPVRVFVDNTGSGATDVLLPGFQVAFDHLNTSQNAIAIDGARGFKFTTATALPAASPYPSGAMDVSGLFSESASGSYYSISMQTPGTDIVIPKGAFGIVYFQVHLALTPYWVEQTPMHYGAKEYPGSSAQGRFISWAGGGVGDNTISVPVGEKVTPKGAINGFKFHDYNHNGEPDQGEPGLDGWDFTLDYSGEFSFTETATSSGGGHFTFSELPAGSYTLDEDISAPWVNTSGLGGFTLDHDQVKGIDVGNHIPPLTKTWELSADNLPGSGVPFVRYSVNGGQSVTATLAGAGPYTADVSVPQGASLSDIGWYLLYGGQEVLLGTSDDETLTANRTNPFTYDASVSGIKYNTETQVGIPGWSIVLKRVVDSVETTYATAVTGEGGVYSFEGVIPGTYILYEIQQNGWVNTHSPTGSFTVADGAHLTGMDFGNLLVRPEIGIVKTGAFGAGANGLADVGELITYDFVVTNVGNVPLSNVSVTDPKVFPVLYVSGDTDLDGKLDLTETWVYTGTYAVTQADIEAGSVYNLATAKSDESAPACDDETVPLPQGPAIGIVKTGTLGAGTNGVADVGELITYQFTVTNAGNVTLHGVTVTDPKVSPVVYVSGDTDMDNALDLTETWVYTGTYAVTQADIEAGSVLNLATADSDESGPDTDDETVPLPQGPALDIVKTGTFGAGANGLADVGELITYNFVVTNTGNVPLSNVSVTDPKVFPVLFVSGDTDLDGKLDLTETWVYTGTYAVTQADIEAGSVLNLATADSDESGPDTDDETVPLPQGPAIGVVKTVSDAEIELGQSVTYTYVVTNTGNVELIDIVLTDDILGAVGEVATLAPDASATFTLVASPTEDTTNVVTAIGWDRQENRVVATDDAFVSVLLPFTPPGTPDMMIDKSADKTEAGAGDTITYTLTYENVGDDDAFDIVITDDFDERYVTVTDAGGGTVSNGVITWTIDGPLSPEAGPQTITYQVRVIASLPDGVRSIDNIALVTAPDDENPDNNSDTWSVDVRTEPFLPFTGGELTLLALAALAATSLGVALRRMGRSELQR